VLEAAAPSKHFAAFNVFAKFIVDLQNVVLSMRVACRR
jgi:hypothetical protein